MSDYNDDEHRLAEAHAQGVADLVRLLLPSPISDDLVQHTDDLPLCAEIVTKYLEADRFEWVKTSDRLPENGVEVLCRWPMSCGEWTSVCVCATYVSGRWWSDHETDEGAPESWCSIHEHDSRADMIAFHLGPKDGSGGVAQIEDAHERLGGECEE